jgi:hypothetical protein
MRSERNAIVFVIGLVVIVGIILTRTIIAARALNREQGQIHCGEVEVQTPTGQKALEHQCWRSKP